MTSLTNPHRPCPTAPLSDDAGRDHNHGWHDWDSDDGTAYWCRGYREPWRPPNYAPPGNPDDPTGQRADEAADRLHMREIEPTAYRPRRTR